MTRWFLGYQKTIIKLIFSVGPGPLPYFADFLMSHYDEDTMVISEKASSLSLPDIWWAETEETPPTLRDQYVFQLFLDD